MPACGVNQVILWCVKLVNRCICSGPFVRDFVTERLDFASSKILGYIAARVGPRNI